jgi:hypothetical protein
MKTNIPKNKLTIKINTPTTNSLIKYFLVFFVASIFVASVFAVATGGESWKYMLFHNGPYTDMYMDFFNSIRDGGSDNVYSERNNIYPPLCVLIFRIISKFVSPDLISTHFKERKLLQADQLCMIIYIIFVLLCIMAMLRLVESYANSKTLGKMQLQSAIISFAMIVSYPIMFCIERGNILILSVVFAMFFIFFKDSDNKIIRELSYISLAFSAAIKIYPAIFGLSLIIEKKYKDAVRLMIYGIFVVAFPFVFFLDEFRADPASISFGISPLLNIASSVSTSAETSSVFTKLIKNLINFAVNKKSTLNLSSVSIQNIVFMFQGTNSLAKLVMGITEAIALVCAFTTKSEWKKIFLLCYLMLNIPSASSSYALSFLIIPFMIFLFGNKEYVRRDWFYLGGYALLLTPLPTLWYFHPEKVKEFAIAIGLYYNTQLNQGIATFVFQLMFIFIVVESIVLATKKMKNKKQIKTSDLQEETAA